MFHTHVVCKVRREAVSPYGGMRYHDACLGDWNGKDVVVSYDIMDWQRVWVKTLQGELICEARFSEATGYRTPTAKEAADEKRALQQIKHREKQITVIRERAGLEGGDGILEGESSRIPDNQSLLAHSAEELAEAEALRAHKKPTMEDTVMWLFAEPEAEEEPLKEEAAS